MTNGDEFFLSQELAELEIISSSFAQHFIPDAKVRKEYLDETRRFAIELWKQVENKQLSPQRAAQQAHAMRNTIMEAMR